MRPIPPTNLDLVRQALHDIPRPDLLANEKLSAWLAERGFTDSPLDIDVITFHYQTEPLGEGRAYTQDNAVITQKLNLVEALLSNWQGESAAGYGGFHYGDWAGIPPTGTLNMVERLEPLGILSNASPYLVFNGLYRRTQPARYAPTHACRCAPRTFRAISGACIFTANSRLGWTPTGTNARRTINAH
nr:hypothetical protein [Pseudomonas putida]